MKSKNCKNCTYYAAYYKQWAGSYEKLNKGFCSKNQTILKQNEQCENFKDNEQKEKIRTELRFDILDQALKAIIEIAQILKENADEKK